MRNYSATFAVYFFAFLDTLIHLRPYTAIAYNCVISIRLKNISAPSDWI